MAFERVILPTPEALAEHAAGLLASALRARPQGLFCLAAGETPRLTYRRTVELLGGFDTSGLRFIGLDEWQGLAPDAEGSCRRFLDETFFGPLGIKPGQVTFFDGRAQPLPECERVARVLTSQGPLDTTVLGLGVNGHLGFNEPGTPATSTIRLAELAPTTVAVGAKYFGGRSAPGRGFTLGLADLLASRRILLLAQGPAKLHAVQGALEGNADVPASTLTGHAGTVFLIDEQAAPRT